MKRASLYSGSRRRAVGSAAAPADPTGPAGPARAGDAATTAAKSRPAASATPIASATASRAAPPSGSAAAPATNPAVVPAAAPAAARSPSGWRRLGPGLRKLLGPAFAAAAGALVVIALQGGIIGPQPVLTQQDIDQAVLNTLETQPLPSPSAKAYRVIGPSVVRVQAFGPESDGPAKPADGARPDVPPKSAAPAPGSGTPDAKGPGAPRPGEAQLGVGSGVVIKESGLILTNLHVVGGARRVAVIFADGTESEATVTGARPEHDLAVLQARTVPDDLQPATMRSTGDLREGDGVVAVGFPFDIGPSVSAGVISGFGREYRSTSGERVLTNLIQFDAAANPGSSGGPLVTLEGEVVGIVTAILNPNNQRSFVGIGFAVPIENAAAAVGVPPH